MATRRSPVLRMPHSVGDPWPPLKSAELGSQPICPAAAISGDGVRVSTSTGRRPDSRLANVSERDDVRATPTGPLSPGNVASFTVVQPPDRATVADPSTRPGFGARVYATVSDQPPAASRTTTLPPPGERCA